MFSPKVNRTLQICLAEIYESYPLTAIAPISELVGENVSFSSVLIDISVEFSVV